MTKESKPMIGPLERVVVAYRLMVTPNRKPLAHGR